MTDKNISATIQCFVKKGNKYLMLHRNQNKKILPNIWVAPGGHKLFRETVFECAKREVKEETGLEIKDIKIKAIGIGYSPAFDENREFCNYILMANYKNGALLENPEDGKYVWLTLSQIRNTKGLFSEVKELLPHIFNNNSKVVSYKAVFSRNDPNLLIEFTVENK